jgi:hypothetical protein
MKKYITDLKYFLEQTFQNPKILLIFTVSSSIIGSLILQHSLESAIIRLILVLCVFKVTRYLMDTSPPYSSKSEIVVKSEGFSRTIVEEQNYISKWVDSTLSVFGGEQKTFHLVTVSYRFLVVKPGYFNLPYILFCRWNQYSWFKKVFQLMILYPHFIVETYTGSFFFGINFFAMLFWLNSFSIVIVIETYFYVFALMVFFRFEGVYQYCIDTYGAAFVEKYIGNPLSNKQFKQLAGKAIVYTASAAASAATAVALNIVDQEYSNARCNKEMDIAIEKRQKQGQMILTLNEYNEIEDKIRKQNLTIFRQVTQTLLEYKKK